MTSSTTQTPLARTAHARHCKHCLFGLPASQTGLDTSRMAVSFYCIGSLDLLGLVDTDSSETSREEWGTWIWRQHVVSDHGSGFRPGPFVVTLENEAYSASTDRSSNDYDLPHIIMTYTALISLSIIKDDFSRLDKLGLVKFLQSCQREDGSFSTVPQSTDSDLRTVYCAFAISSLLGDWSGIDVARAVDYIRRCRTYEGGYGQSPCNEAQGSCSCQFSW
jgi:geranylgeranyl transferase type-1 subunit beta